jgi:hypothetical protein
LKWLEMTNRAGLCAAFETIIFFRLHSPFSKVLAAGNFVSWFLKFAKSVKGS